MGLRHALPMNFAQHFRDRLFERYGILMDRYEVEGLVNSLKTALPASSRLFLGPRLGSQDYSHQEVWWVRLQTKWVVVVYDGLNHRLVTALPPKNFASPDLLARNPNTPPRLATPGWKFLQK